MRGKLIFVAGAAVGYVLGSRAGHHRYEQIASGASKVWNSRAAVKQRDKVGDAAAEILPTAVGVLFRAVLWAVKKLLGIQTKPRGQVTATYDR
ncbi:hypothetical protein [Frondihabitans cladoniiphilus]|uniref:Secreted protein n=1 Tax=Frondihabitans cladoniiphilus TaxID=715785 RepID=A0ABP8VYG7_9MICO